MVTAVAADWMIHVEKKMTFAKEMTSEDLAVVVHLLVCKDNSFKDSYCSVNISFSYTLFIMPNFRWTPSK